MEIELCLYIVIAMACVFIGYSIGLWRASRSYHQAISNIIKRKGKK